MVSKFTRNTQGITDIAKAFGAGHINQNDLASTKETGSTPSKVFVRNNRKFEQISGAVTQTYIADDGSIVFQSTDNKGGGSISGQINFDENDFTVTHDPDDNTKYVIKAKAKGQAVPYAFTILSEPNKTDATEVLTITGLAYVTYSGEATTTADIVPVTAQVMGASTTNIGLTTDGNYGIKFTTVGDTDVSTLKDINVFMTFMFLIDDVTPTYLHGYYMNNGGMKNELASFQFPASSEGVAITSGQAGSQIGYK